MKVEVNSNINKKQYEIQRLTSYDIETTLDIPADYFSITIENPIDYKTKSGINANIFNDNDEVKIYENNKLILNGISDDVDEFWNENASSIEISGRDKALILIENDSEPKTYYDMNLQIFITTLASPLGFSVKVNSKYDKVVKKRVVEVGDTVWDAIFREVKKLNLWIWCEPNGIIKVDKLNYKESGDYYFSNDFNKLQSKYHNYIPMKSLSKKKKGADIKNEVWVRGHGKKTFTAKHKDSELSNKGYKRKLITEDSEAKDLNKGKEIAKRIINERKRGSYEIELSINGKHDIEINKTAYIYDPITKLDGVFFIVGIRNQKNETNGMVKILRLRPLWEGL